MKLMARCRAEGTSETSCNTFKVCETTAHTQATILTKKKNKTDFEFLTFCTAEKHQVTLGHFHHFLTKDYRHKKILEEM